MVQDTRAPKVNSTGNIIFKTESKTTSAQHKHNASWKTNEDKMRQTVESKRASEMNSTGNIIFKLKSKTTSAQYGQL